MGFAPVPVAWNLAQFHHQLNQSYTTKGRVARYMDLGLHGALLLQNIKHLNIKK
jgi:hypothetical protein